MAHEFNCTNCGKLGYGSSGSGPMSGSNPPSGWKTKMLSTKIFCSNKCKDEFNNRNSSTKSDIKGANQSHHSEQPKEKSGGFLSSLNDSLDREDAKVEAQINNISQIEFGSSIDDISNTLNYLVTVAAGKPSRDIKKVIYQKMEFAIMKLRQQEANTEADFFEKKRAEIKPKWYE